MKGLKIGATIGLLSGVGVAVFVAFVFAPPVVGALVVIIGCPLAVYFSALLIRGDLLWKNADLSKSRKIFSSSEGWNWSIETHRISRKHFRDYVRFLRSDFSKNSI